MLQGLAIWHYPHRSISDNIRFFASQGFDSLSVHGAQMVNALEDPTVGKELASAVCENGIVLTVHYSLPRNHSTEAVEVFRRGISALAEWQREYGLISVLSFDVPQSVRDGAGIGTYLSYVLETVSDCRIAVEDFGLNQPERDQIIHLKGHLRFGYLVDIGHLFLRIRGLYTGGKTLFTYAPDEHIQTLCPDRTAFRDALASKEFPIFEIHLHNNDGVNDLHWFLEQGELNIRAVADALKDLQYDGILTIESAPGYRFECRGNDADEGILRTFSYWKSLL